jgi:hypothetical protein
MTTLGLRTKYKDTADRNLLPEPTAFPPGSAGKIAELGRRFSAGVQLWHPDDDRHPHYRSSPSARPRTIDYESVESLAELAHWLMDVANKNNVRKNVAMLKSK